MCTHPTRNSTDASNLRILYYNARSILPKFDNLLASTLTLASYPGSQRGEGEPGISCVRMRLIMLRRTRVFGWARSIIRSKRVSLGHPTSSTLFAIARLERYQQCHYNHQAVGIGAYSSAKLVVEKER